MEARCASSNRIDYAASWKAAFLLWGIPAALAMFGLLLSAQRAWLWPIAFAWAGVGCMVNARHCGRVHCTFTGPLYLLLAALGLGQALGLFAIGWGWFWLSAAIGTLLSFVPEWKGRKYWR
jgi:hypothetical protein